MTPSKYVLKVHKGFIELRVFDDGVPEVGSVVEGCVLMAKRWKVSFIDETQETQT